jgi:hypothetical protein
LAARANRQQQNDADCRDRSRATACSRHVQTMAEASGYQSWQVASICIPQGGCNALRRPLRASETLPDGGVHMSHSDLERRIDFGPHRIFISYRHSDTQALAGRLADDLRRHFGELRVFRDIESNRPARDYRRVITETLRGARAAIILIGPSWASCADDRGNQRLRDAEDMVRVELECALANGLDVLPVLVDDAVMPRADELPASLASFPRLGAMELNDRSWRYDLHRILERLETLGLRADSSFDQSDSEPLTARVKNAVTQVQRYERVFGATRPQVFQAVIGTVEGLRYRRLEEDPEAALVRFSLFKVEVTVKVIDATVGHARVVVQFSAARTAAIVASAFLAPAGFGAFTMGAVATRLWGRRFAIGFLNSVQRVLEGRSVGVDPSLPPGIESWRNRSRDV